jgi:hypothetical protein
VKQADATLGEPVDQASHAVPRQSRVRGTCCRSRRCWPDYRRCVRPSGRSRRSGRPCPRVQTSSSRFLPCAISWVFSPVRIDASGCPTVSLSKTQSAGRSAHPAPRSEGRARAADSLCGLADSDVVAENDAGRLRRPRPTGLGNALIAPKTTVIGTGQMKCRERLGGLLIFTTARPHSRMGRVFAHDGGVLPQRARVPRLHARAAETARGADLSSHADQP